MVARIAIVVALLAVTASCKARRDMPELNPGWHNGDYSVVFGKLVRGGGATADSPTIWTLRFGTGNDAYQGELALTPGEKLAGYSGGETVEVRGHLLNQQTTDAFNGRWYVVDGIRMWGQMR